MTAKISPYMLVINRYTKRRAAYRDRVSQAIVVLTSSTAVFLPFLRFRRPAGGGSIKSVYDAFVVCIIFAFSCALSAMFVYRKPKAARVLRLCGIMWLAAAILLFIHGVFLIHRLS